MSSIMSENLVVKVLRAVDAVSVDMINTYCESMFGGTSQYLRMQM